MTQLDIQVSGCIEKNQMVDRIVQSGKVDIVEGLPPIEISLDNLSGKSVKELRYLLVSFGLSADGALEKSELIDRLVASRRFVIVEGEASRTIDENIMSGGSADKGMHYFSELSVIL